jgi:hypothetical protein
MQENSSRFARIEGQIMTLAGQVFQGQSATTAAVVEMQDQIHTMMSMMSSMFQNFKSQAMPTQVPPLVLLQPLEVPPPSLLQPRADVVQKLCAFCDASSKRCTSTISLQHMLSCQQCPDASCKHLSISQHLFKYKNEPLVGFAEGCCWCGKTWDECTNSSNSQSPKSADAQSKHKKSCHVKCHNALQSDIPATVDATKAVLDRIWSNVAGESHRTKRARRPLQQPPIIGKFTIDEEIDEGRTQGNELVRSSSSGWSDCSLDDEDGSILARVGEFMNT